MHHYVYVRPGHPDDGMGYCSPDPILWGPDAEGDARYYVPVSPPSPPLDEVRDRAIRRINRDAGASRAKYITAIPGQETTYSEKRAEATAFQQDPNPEASHYPMLAAEAQATGQTMAQVSAEVLSLAAQWRQIGAHIEGVRRGAIMKVQNARTVEEVELVSWAFP